MIHQTLCPVCGKPPEEAGSGKPSALPFCSDRCRKIDFFRWWDGRYAIVEELNPDSATVDDDLLIPDDSVEW
jgi:endogenous inhibitor of DNA gyrase (YacG/DUF329 family)